MAKKKIEFSYNDTYQKPASQADNIDGWQNTEQATQGQDYSRKEIKVPVLLVRPDRFQPRLQLPEIIGKEFYSGDIDCFEAARKWFELANIDPVFKQKMDKLIELGSSLDEYGQIKPVTGNYQENPVTGQREFFLETGERRFWSVVIDAVNKKNIGQHVTVTAKKEADFSPERQAEENEKVEPLSAVGRAREVARLLLYYQGILPDHKVDYGFCGYHRQINSIRIPGTDWDKVIKITSLARSTLYQLIKILRMDDVTLTLADGYSIPFRVLINISESPKSNQQEMILEWIKDNQEFHNDGGVSTSTKQIIKNSKKTMPGQGDTPKISALIKHAKKMRLMILPNIKRLEKEVENPIYELSKQLYSELKGVDEIKLSSERFRIIADTLDDMLKKDIQ